MSSKADYTEAEWKQLIQAPVNVGMLVIMADLHVTSMPGEMKGMLKGMVEQPVPEGAQELIDSLLEDVKSRSENKEKMETPETSSKDAVAIKAEMLQLLGSATALVAATGGEDEAAGYKQWLMGVAKATAEAGKEGGFLGIGAVRVSEKEKMALQEISQTLGLQ